MMNKKVLTNVTRQKVILLLSVLLWIETIIAYFMDFNLGIEGPLQIVIALFNPFGFILLILSIANYFVRKKTFTTAIIILFALETIILIANVIYYREFSDFISIDTILSAQKFNGAMEKSITTLLMPQDGVYLINLTLIILLPFLIQRYLQTQPTRMVNKVALTDESAVIMSLKDYRSFKETLYLLNDGTLNKVHQNMTDNAKEMDITGGIDWDKIN
ncbi:hypothetical protein [Companilactobacillus muriivasis]|uniref:hypothetical protein n=1 Tax=Companilactobacillus muriivasis TaxID=3081444 RepID=UPI0030C68510